MTATSSSQSTEHMIQICRERSSRGVATRADWQRLAEINPDRARRELVSYLQVNQLHPAANPYESKPAPRIGLAAGFVFGVLFMAAWWWFGDYLQRTTVTSGKQWDLVAFSQYVAASLLPVFAWLGWRFDHKRAANSPSELKVQKFSDASWEELLAHFDKTRKAGGTRMY